MPRPENRLARLIRDNASTREPVRADVTDEGVTLWIYDMIDSWWGISAQEVARMLASAGEKKLTVRFNSPGGDVFEARAIASLIKAHKGETVAVVDALAASAATTVAMACQTIEMATGSFLMVHNAWSIAIGNRDELRQLADLLEKIDGEIGADYAAKAGVTKDQAAAWMAAETWFTAQEAVDAKLADRVSGEEAQHNGKLNLGAYDKVPEALANAIRAAASRDAGPSPDEIRAHAARRLKLFDLAA